MYHEDDKIRVPELDNSQCSVPAMICCAIRSIGPMASVVCKLGQNIKGVCSKTVCECNQQENKELRATDVIGMSDGCVRDTGGMQWSSQR